MCSPLPPPPPASFKLPGAVYARHHYCCCCCPVLLSPSLPFFSLPGSLSLSWFFFFCFFVLFLFLFFFFFFFCRCCCLLLFGHFLLFPPPSLRHAPDLLVCRVCLTPWVHSSVSRALALPEPATRIRLSFHASPRLIAPEPSKTSTRRVYHASSTPPSLPVQRVGPAGLSLARAPAPTLRLTPECRSPSPRRADPKSHHLDALDQLRPPAPTPTRSRRSIAPAAPSFFCLATRRPASGVIAVGAAVPSRCCCRCRRRRNSTCGVRARPPACLVTSRLPSESVPVWLGVALSCPAPLHRLRFSRWSRCKPVSPAELDYPSHPASSL